MYTRISCLTLCVYLRELPVRPCVYIYETYLSCETLCVYRRKNPVRPCVYIYVWYGGMVSPVKRSAGDRTPQHKKIGQLILHFLRRQTSLQSPWLLRSMPHGSARQTSMRRVLQQHNADASCPPISSIFSWTVLKVLMFPIQLRGLATPSLSRW